MSDERASGNGAVPQEHMSDPLVVRLSANGSADAPLARSVAHQPPGTLHLAVSLQVVDLSGERWLLQRRATAKALFADRWANTCCTHPAPGEDPSSAVLRRVREETGLAVDNLVGAGSFTYRATDHQSGLVEHEHDFVFVAVVDAWTAEPDPNEISELGFFAFEDAVRLLQSDDGAPWAADVLRLSHAAHIRRRLPATARFGALRSRWR